jgi:hypothetical protein
MLNQQGILTITAPKRAKEAEDFVERRISINFENFDKVVGPNQVKPKRRLFPWRRRK